VTTAVAVITVRFAGMVIVHLAGAKPDRVLVPVTAYVER